MSEAPKKSPKTKSTPKTKSKPSPKKVASAQKAVLKKRTKMARGIATKWVLANVRPEFRFTAYINGGETEIRKFSNLIKGFRDGNIGIKGVIHKKEIGIEEGFDSITFWGSDLSFIKTLCEWFESKCHGTTGIWW